jgi:hypothetical protein
VTAPSLHQPTLESCPECETPLAGKYCHECGERPPDAHDLTLRHFLHHGLHELTHFDSKIFRTLKTLIVTPGVLTADYLAGRKKRYVLPLRLFLVIFALNFFLYTRPGVALYDIRVILAASPQGQLLDTKFEHKAAKMHMTKEALYEHFNEHWQHNLSFFQLGDVFFFAVCLAIVNRRRYFVEHLIFALHTLSFTFLFSCVVWLYYAHYGFRQNAALILTSIIVSFLYLWRALPKVYKTTGWNTLAKSFLVVIGLEISRAFFMIFTFVLAMIQALRGH